MTKIKTSVLGILLLLLSPAGTQGQVVGEWQKDKDGLPVFEYTGEYPFSAENPAGEKTEIPDDPFFILGNYRMTLFSHVSGQIQLITGERAWGRLNQGDVKNTGANKAFLTIDGEELVLAGKGSLAENRENLRTLFGTGYAIYEYELPGNLILRKTLSVPPSKNPYVGLPAFITRVEIINNDDHSHSVEYRDLIRANYQMAYQQSRPVKVKYKPNPSRDIPSGIMKVSFLAEPLEPYLWKNKDDMSDYDGFPPCLFSKLSGTEGKISEVMDDDHLYIMSSISRNLAQGESAILEFITGFSYRQEIGMIESMCREIERRKAADAGDGLFFRNEWAGILPGFGEEKDEVLRRELVWNAYVVECSATYSDYFGETQIPSGTSYDYDWGIHVCARDHAQLLLPLCYYRPELVKSGLRYLMKKTHMNGRLDNDEIGYGVVTSRMFDQSDNQLYFMWIIGEYLRITGDYPFLLEKVKYYPRKNSSEGDAVEHLEVMFRYLRDYIGRGRHGLIRMLNSDWNDDYHFVINPAPYNRMWEQAESHVNSGMAIIVLKNLMDALEPLQGRPEYDKDKRITSLLEGMKYYHQQVYSAFLDDLEGRDFSRRAYFTDNQPYGDKFMHLLPTAYALQLDSLNVERKEELFKAVDDRLLSMEVFGARSREDEEPGHYAHYGAGENGGIWHVSNSQLILGVASFDKERAWKLYKRRSWDNLSRAFPQYWTGYWTSGDYIVSSVSENEGMSYNYPFCTLPHTFGIYLWYRLNGK